MFCILFNNSFLNFVNKTNFSKLSTKECFEKIFKTKYYTVLNSDELTIQREVPKEKRKSEIKKVSATRLF